MSNYVHLKNDYELYTSSSEHSSFPAKQYIERTYKTGTAVISLKGKYKPQVINEIFAKGGQILSTTKTDATVSDLLKIDQNNFWIYLLPSRKTGNDIYVLLNDIIISFNLEAIDSKKDTSLEGFIFSEEDSGVGDIDKPLSQDDFVACITLWIPTSNFNNLKVLDFIKDFSIVDKKENNISILIKNQYGDYDFEPLKVSVPEDMDLELNYGKKFLTVHDNVVEKLNNNDKGLYLFHGEPGTGKTTYIKYLTNLVKKDFIFVPTTMLDRFVNDPDVLGMMVRRKKAVLVLEDAEKILISRESGDNPFISTLLNVSDGIMADILKTAIIVTFNSNEKMIDKAIKRKGRTMVDYKFEKLSLEEALKIAKKLKFKKDLLEEIKEPMTLTDIYNLADRNSFLEKEEKQDKVIGFNVR
jgi:hypothetical protein